MKMPDTHLGEEEGKEGISKTQLLYKTGFVFFFFFNKRLSCCDLVRLALLLRVQQREKEVRNVVPTQTLAWLGWVARLHPQGRAGWKARGPRSLSSLG